MSSLSPVDETYLQASGLSVAVCRDPASGRLLWRATEAGSDAVNRKFRDLPKDTYGGYMAGQRHGTGKRVRWTVIYGRRSDGDGVLAVAARRLLRPSVDLMVHVVGNSLWVAEVTGRIRGFRVASDRFHKIVECEWSEPLAPLRRRRRSPRTQLSRSRRR